MNEVAKQEGAGPADTVKLVAAILIAVAGIVAFYALKGEQSDWVRWLAFVGALVVGVVVFALSQHGRDAWKFVLDSRIELYKVFWPTRQETGMTTLVVFGFVLIMGLFFWGIDAILAWLTRLVLGGASGAGPGNGIGG
jgi:preprotein translocase subunit SecE